LVISIAGRVLVVVVVVVVVVVMIIGIDTRYAVAAFSTANNDTHTERKRLSIQYPSSDHCAFAIFKVF
jgi:hypothetical protein